MNLGSYRENKVVSLFKLIFLVLISPIYANITEKLKVFLSILWKIS